MPSDDLRARLDKAFDPPYFPDQSEEARTARFAESAAGTDPLHELILDRLEAIARAHASERIESFAAMSEYCPWCGRDEETPHQADCPYDNGEVAP